MDTNKMREQFEEWAAKNYVIPPGSGSLFVRDELGDGYRLSSINHAWHGWKASREAAVVELPATGTLLVPGWNQAIHRCRECIEAKGVKVAP